MKTPIHLFYIGLLSFGSRIIAAVDEAYVDLSFTCPIATLCPQVCAPTLADCPIDLICNGSEDCNLTTPSFASATCTSPCAPVACGGQQIIAPMETCNDRYGEFYEYAGNCTTEETDTTEEVEEEDDITKINSLVVFLSLWVTCGTAAIIAWCRFNQIHFPVEGSKKPFHLDVGDDAQQTRSYQVGYKRTWLGIVLHGIALSIYFGWIVMMSITMVLAYSFTNEDNIVITLHWFCASWNGGFFWSMAMYWPYNIQALFLRRCVLSEATHIAVIHEFSHARQDKARPILEQTKIVPQFVKDAFGFIKTLIEKVLVQVFTAENARADPRKGIKQYCLVKTNDDGSKYFSFLFRRYNFDEEQHLFSSAHYNLGETFADLAPQGVTVENKDEVAPLVPYGISSEEAIQRVQEVGANVIEMDTPSFLSTFMTEISKTFYLYQFYIIWIWFVIQYYYMSFVIWCSVFATAVIISWFRYRSECVLYSLTHTHGSISAYRNGLLVQIDQRELVPGDVVKIEPGQIHCDMLLLSGETVTDESALTGEATPQPKLPIDTESNEKYDLLLHKRQTLFAGTSVIECENALALVTRTASYTNKGELMREIIGFRTHRVDIYKELPIAVGFLTAYSAFCFGFAMFNSSDEPVLAWALGMTAFSNAFPALLPISFTIPVGISFDRLTKLNVTCSHSDSILMAGKVNRAFFDKTGTLTRQGLDFVSSRSAESWTAGQWGSEDLDLAMSTCHALTLTQDREIIGNPVDQAMFRASGATLRCNEGKTYSIKLPSGSGVEILRRFDFDHNRMTQGVIIKLADGRIKAIVKGSAERIAEICHSVPESYDVLVKNFSRSGMYQIGVAWKDIDSIDAAMKMVRDDLEESLNFLGMLNFANKIRERTPEVIETLHDCGVESIMLTGDNLFTGVHVARESTLLPYDGKVLFAELQSESIRWYYEDGDKIVNVDSVEDILFGSDEVFLALSGDAWRHIQSGNSSLALKIAPRIRVVGRCLPNDKITVVETFNSLGYTTSMCGDGGNDCGALKAAHIGIALSDGDASLVAPFTSLKKDIASILDVLREGRCAVVSTISTYKYMVMYGNISSYCQLITYKFNTSFSDWMWVFTDGVWTICFCLTIPFAKSASKLSILIPTSSILGWQTVSSVVGAICLNYIFMTIALSFLFSEAWFSCRKWDASIQAGSVLSASDNYETEVTFLMVGYQCIFAGMIFNFGFEFRKAWWRNYPFAILSTVFLLIHVYATMVPGRLSCFWRVNCTNEFVSRGVTSPDPVPLGNPFNTTIMPLAFRIKLLCIALSNGMSLALYEYFFVNGCFRHLANYFRENEIGMKDKPRLEQAPPLRGESKSSPTAETSVQP